MGGARHRKEKGQPLLSELQDIHIAKQQARSIAADAGLNVNGVNFSGSSDTLWGKLHCQAKNEQKLDALINVVKAKYPSRLGNFKAEDFAAPDPMPEAPRVNVQETFRPASQASQATPGGATPPSPRRTTPSRKTMIGSAALVALLVAIAIASVPWQCVPRPVPSLPDADEEIDAALIDEDVARPSPPPPAPKPPQPCPDDMVLIPSGEFLMGSPDHEGRPDEHPQHRVRFERPFCIDRMEVAVRAYEKCVAAGACILQTTVEWPGLSPDDRLIQSNFCNGGHPDRADAPMNCVNWAESRVYCEWGGQAGGPRRLPREAEWEYAARGSTSRTFPWGEMVPSQALTNLCGEECARDQSARNPLQRLVSIPGWDDHYASTAPVGAFNFDVTPEGVRDLAGNVFEWVEDVYVRDAYAASQMSRRHSQIRGVAFPSRGGDLRGTRGGGWGDADPSFTRGASRDGDQPSGRYNEVGFRCARAARESRDVRNPGGAP